MMFFLHLPLYGSKQEQLVLDADKEDTLCLNPTVSQALFNSLLNLNTPKYG